MVGIRLKKGKGDFVRRKLPDGTIEDVCLCKFNADLSMQGCISQVPGRLLDEVVENKGKYSKETIEKEIKRHGKLPNEKCDYCYARRHNWGRVTRMQVNDKTQADFEEYHPEFVRLGKVAEAGHSFYQELLIEFLELCRQFGTRVILPTKMLTFDNQLAELFQETGSVLIYSIGYDKLEKGACSQGYANEWRIEQAQQYARRGVNATLTLVCDITSSIKQNAKHGSAAEKALKARTEGLTIRILPLRLNSREVAYAVTGKDWYDLIYKQVDSSENVLPGFEENVEEVRQGMEQRQYALRGNNEAYPRYFHADFKDLIAHHNLGVCGRVDDMEYCDKCNLFGDARIVFPVSELAEVVYDRKIRVERKRYIRRGREKRGTLKFKWQKES